MSPASPKGFEYFRQAHRADVNYCQVMLAMAGTAKFFRRSRAGDLNLICVEQSSQPGHTVLAVSDDQQAMLADRTELLFASCSSLRTHCLLTSIIGPSHVIKYSLFGYAELLG
jgi:hypothetical protein